MPIYEYNCAACHMDFELLVNKNTKVSCTSCGSEDVSKKISSFAFSVASQMNSPGCASACNEGFTKGACGSGMCCGGDH